MALTKYKIGDLISVIDEENEEGIRDFFGINIHKEFMPTNANTEGLDESKYKIVRNQRFVYSGMQTGRDKCIRISMYTGDKPVIVSPAYVTFEITATDKVLPIYFFMCFLSHEKDRYGAFLSDGSIRTNLDWPVFCDMELNLPSLSIQQKYVNIYTSLLENQKKYEQGLDDLKLVCDVYIEKLRKEMPSKPIGPYITRCDRRNGINGTKNVKGLSTKKEFRPAQSRVDINKLEKYKVVEHNDFVFVPTTDTWKVLAFAYNAESYPVVVSPIYEVFSVDKKVILPGYLALWLRRKDFDRYARFHSWGSARENFTFENMCDVKIPIPSIKIQQDIVNIYDVCNLRKEINEKLKEQIKNICPILIKGAVEEAQKEA